MVPKCEGTRSWFLSVGSGSSWSYQFYQFRETQEPSKSLLVTRTAQEHPLIPMENVLSSSTAQHSSGFQPVVRGPPGVL